MQSASYAIMIPDSTFVNRNTGKRRALFVKYVYKAFVTTNYPNFTTL